MMVQKILRFCLAINLLILIAACASVQGTRGIASTKCEEFLGGNFLKEPPETQKVLCDLYTVFLDNPALGGSHRVGVSKLDGAWVVKVGLLKREQKQVLVSLLRAMRSGQIARINGGMVVGSRTLMLLESLSRAQAAPGFEVVGMFDLAGIMKDFEDEVRKSQALAAEKQVSTNPAFWTERDVASFYKAIENLGLKGEIDQSLQDSDYVGHFIQIRWVKKEETQISVLDWSQYREEF